MDTHVCLFYAAMQKAILFTNMELEPNIVWPNISSLPLAGDGSWRESIDGATQVGRRGLNYAGPMP